MEKTKKYDYRSLCKRLPGKYKKDLKLNKIDKIKLSKNDYIFHAGTKLSKNRLLSNGGRVLNVTSIGDSYKKIRKNIITILNKIAWKYGYYRKDIGQRVINKNENN